MVRSEALGYVAVAVGAVVVATLLSRRRRVPNGGNAPGTPPMTPWPPGTGVSPGPPPPISRIIPTRPALPQPVGPPRLLLGGGIR